MFRSVCPMCQEPSSFDDTRAGREVECPRCRSAFVTTPGRDEADEKPYRPQQSDGQDDCREVQHHADNSEGSEPRLQSDVPDE